MAEFSLVPHPAFPSSAVDSIAVEVSRDDGALAFTYRLAGGLQDVYWPAFDPSEPRRAERLWETTCFEAFVRPMGQRGYVELNFAPSMKWAAYVFEDYRAHMIDMAGEVVCSGLARETRDEWRFGTFLTFEMLALELNLSAVIEATDGTKSYWALAHAPGPPDFHNRDCFIATLPAPQAT